MARPCIYPWDNWLTNTKTVLLSSDYRCSQRSMCVLIRMRSAKLDNWRYSVYPRKDGTIIIVPRVKVKPKC